jgi:hypothetical protein
MTTPGDVRNFAHRGTNSGPSIRGTGSSNPFPSANQSSIFGILWRERAKHPRVRGFAATEGYRRGRLPGGRTSRFLKDFSPRPSDSVSLRQRGALALQSALGLCGSQR